MVRRNVLPHPATLKCEMVDFSETLEHLYHTAHHRVPIDCSSQILVLACEYKFFYRRYSVDPLKLKI